jgi:tRNA-Thr(GGU) m(6)t(6)A37 methyltransferase TsaA
MKKIELTPIGYIYSPLKEDSDIPVQPKYSEEEGTIELLEKYTPALKDLDGFEYIICIVYLHKIKPPIPLQTPSHWDNEKHGIFALRTPRRPNPIGLSVLKLNKIKGNLLYVSNLDFLDETPVLDIKPFVPSIDNRETNKVGWIKDKA